MLLSNKHIDSSELENLEEQIIKLNRVTKVVKGGRTFSFSAFVVVGNKDGIVGLGFGKAKEITEAIKKASSEARNKLHKIELFKHTIPFAVEKKFCSSRVRLLPASEGTGIIANSNVRLVLEFAGIQNVLSKSYGSRNAINCAKATLESLLSLRSAPKMAKQRDVAMSDFFN